jgi:putative membrane protein
MIVVRHAKVSTLLGYVGRPLAILIALDVAVAAAYVWGGWKWLSLPDIPVSVFGGVIGVIAGFRNASAYARWWEARTIWGGIVNQSRIFAREVLTMITAPEPDAASEREVAEVRHRLVFLQIAYVHALRNHLRGTPPWDDLAAELQDEDWERWQAYQNVPLAIQRSMADLVAGCYKAGWIDTIRWTALDRTLSALMEGQGASERIKNTPMPRLYDHFIGLFITIYCMLLPLGMVESLRLLTPIGSTLVGFMFLALDRIGRSLENPFEDLPHDIPLTAIDRTIEISLKEMLGDSEVPEPLKPVNGVLW